MAPKNSGRVVLLSSAVGLIVGCFVASLTFSIMPKAADMFITFPLMNSQQHFVSPVVEDTAAGESQKDEFEGTAAGRSRKDASPVVENTAAGESRKATSPATSRELPTSNGVLDNQAAQVEKIDSSPVITADPIQKPSKEIRKILCDPSHRRCDVCDISGDVRIAGQNSSSVTLVAPPSRSSDETWTVQPYARKWDPTSMKRVREVKVRTSALTGAPPLCEVNHGAVPAVVFSIAGYTGNYFHDFTDVLVPLFQTARQFDGEVQLIVANYKSWWIAKYKSYFDHLSNYDVIDFDNDARVHCFNHVIVGLRSDSDMTIEPANSPMKYSMLDFMKFMRESYSLKRDHPQIKKKTKPRLLIIARKRTRKFMNLDVILAMAKDLGFEVVTAEPANFDVAKFARIVNSCDVMMGVHGAGLTNIVFLPPGAVLIQVVPFGKLDWIASTYFAKPAEKMKLHYLEYAIGVEESSLTELYSREDKVFKDPAAIHKRGWAKMGEIYLDKQNVKLDAKRFRPVLEKALEFLHQNHVEQS